MNLVETFRAANRIYDSLVYLSFPQTYHYYNINNKFAAK